MSLTFYSSLTLLSYPFSGYFDRGSQYHGIGQNLDTRCLHQNINSLYEVKAWFRLEQDGVPFICDRYSGSYPMRCPKATIKYGTYDDPEEKQQMIWTYAQDKAFVITPNDSSDFNLFHGIMKIGDIYESIHRAFIYFEHYDRRYDMILDDVSITRMERICSGDFMRNGDLSTGDTRFWASYHSSRRTTVSGIPGISKGDFAMKVYSRNRDDAGPRQELHIDIDCLSDRDRFKVEARYQLQDSDGNPIRCDILVDNTIEECAWLRVKAYSVEQGEPHPYVGQTVAMHPDLESDWAITSGIFTLGHAQANHTRMYSHIGGPHKDVNILLDYLSIEPLPKNCQNMILNPSFESGSTKMWRRTDRRADFSIYSPGRNDAYALSRRIENGKSNYGNLHQSLDVRCLVKGQKYKLKAYFKLLNATDTSQTIACDPGETK